MAKGQKRSLRWLIKRLERRPGYRLMREAVLQISWHMQPEFRFKSQGCGFWSHFRGRRATRWSIPNVESRHRRPVFVKKGLEHN